MDCSLGRSIQSRFTCSHTLHHQGSTVNIFKRKGVVAHLNGGEQWHI